MSDSISSLNTSHDLFPQRVPLKIIGRDDVLEISAIASIILDHLGEQDETDWHSNKKGGYVSYTFWVVLPDKHSEERLRKAIHALPGIVTQL
jgi:putative lipoic acid-binding regulatory protein